MSFLEQNDTTPESIRKARSLFDIYDKLPDVEKHTKLKELSKQLDIRWSTAWRWVNVTRPSQSSSGDSWPYYEDTEDVPQVNPGDSEVAVNKKLYGKEAPKPIEDTSVPTTDIASLKKAASLDNANFDTQLAHANIIALQAEPIIARADKRAVYVQEQDTYYVFLNKTKPPLLVPRHQHEYMLSAYSDWDGHAVASTDIAKTVGLTLAEFNSYKTLFGWTRKTMPITKPQIATMSVDEAIEELTLMKETAIQSKWEEQSKRDDVRDAKKWRNFKSSILGEVTKLVEQTTAVPFHEPHLTVRDDGDYSLMLPLNDWQIGSYANSEVLRFGRTFDVDTFNLMIDDYVYQLQQYLDRNANASWNVPYIVILGDILHGMIGETVHGTKLSKHMREFDYEQVRIAIDGLIKIADTVVAHFGTAKIIGLPGNHEGYISTLLAEVLAQRYRDNNVELVAHNNRTHYEMIGCSLFVFDHGASPDSGIKGGKIPRSGRNREVMVKDLVYARADMVADARAQRGGVYFVMGDQHVTIDEQMTGVEFLLLPSIVSGDVYADQNGWYSRPAQSLMLIDHNSGLKHSERLYFDNKRVFPDS